MLRLGRYSFKRAETPADFEQIHRLNYRTFVQEIPQHEDSGNGYLVDKFHSKNTYFLAFRGAQLVGMLSAHDQAPFSVSSRLPDPKVLEKPDLKPLEVRLLAIEPEERNSATIVGLVYSLFCYGRVHGHTHFIISGVTEQAELYKHIGFEAMGPPVGRPGAQFVPMIASLDRVESQMQRTMKHWERRIQRETSITDDPVSLLPGPVPLSPEVRQAFQEHPIYHRGPEFVTLFEDVRHSLANLTNAGGVALTVGSGTLANEAIAASLAVDSMAKHGLMLVNGEFGRRIAKQVVRFGMNPPVLEWPWGQPWDLDQVAEALDRVPPGGWVWGVHQESSTGVINDLPGLVAVARERGIRVCVDCVSSLGAVPLDLSEVYLASGATGKALSSYAGLSLIFADPEQVAHLDTDRIPAYLDIPATLANAGPRFTVPSPLLKALAVALEVYSTPAKAQARFDHYAELGRHVRTRLRDIGLPPLADENYASPVITSFYPPGEETASDFVTRCETWGFLIGGQSGYLAEQRLVQIANMGAISQEDLDRLFVHLEVWLARSKAYQSA
jgi:aspartate aminotransferase-like enzyme